MNKASEVKRDELERIKQIIRTLQPAAEIIECDYADADLDKIIYTEAFDFERTATSAGWIRGIESALTEEQKKKRRSMSIIITMRSMHTIIIMKVVKWMNMASVLLCIIVVRLLISINLIVLYPPSGVVILFEQKESVISAIIVICLFFLNRPVCRKVEGSRFMVCYGT